MSTSTKENRGCKEKSSAREIKPGGTSSSFSTQELPNIEDLDENKNMERSITQDLTGMDTDFINWSQDYPPLPATPVIEKQNNAATSPLSSSKKTKVL